MSLVRATATIGSFTLVSRLLGFLRDMLIARFLGAGVLSDAFLVAFKIPNFMRQLFAEGAFNAAFLPLYAGTRAGEGDAAAKKLANEVHAGLLAVLIAVSALGVLFMPQLMLLLAPGFDSDPREFAGVPIFDLTVTLTRITFPYILFISLVSLQGGILNSHGKFAAVAGTPVLMNITLILAMLILPDFTETTGHALAFGVLLAGLVQYLWLVHVCRRAGLMPSFCIPRMTQGVRRLLRLIGPAALGSGVTQINLVINTIIASHIAGAVSVLYYAVRLEELPFGVIGIAISTALLPLLARQLREGKTAEAMHSQNRALELAMLFGLPATMALCVIPFPIVQVVYERGAFTPADTDATYVTLIAYALGLPAALAVKIFASAFYAGQNTKTPVRIAMIAVAVNLVLNLILMHSLRHVGLALSTSVASWVNAALLLRALRARGLFALDEKIAFRLPRMAMATALMGLILMTSYAILTPWFGQDGGQAGRIVCLALLIGVGAGSYGALLIGLRVVRPAELRQYFRRG